jgi:hypothetical protein
VGTGREERRSSRHRRDDGRSLQGERRGASSGDPGEDTAGDLSVLTGSVSGPFTRIELLNDRSPADRRAANLVGTSGSVGREWPPSHLLSDPRPVKHLDT